MTKDEFLLRLNLLNINKKTFAEISQVPYSTINNWGTMKNGKPLPVPPWVEPLLTYYEKSLKLDYISKEICEKFYSMNKDK